MPCPTIARRFTRTLAVTWALTATTAMAAAQSRATDMRRLLVVTEVVGESAVTPSCAATTSTVAATTVTSTAQAVATGPATTRAPGGTSAPCPITIVVAPRPSLELWRYRTWQIDRLDEQIGELDRDLAGTNERRVELLNRALKFKQQTLDLKRQIESLRRQAGQLRRTESSLLTRLRRKQGADEPDDLTAARNALTVARRRQEQAKDQVIRQLMHQPEYAQATRQIQTAVGQLEAIDGLTAAKRQMLANQILALQKTTRGFERAALDRDSAFQQAIAARQAARRALAALSRLKAESIQRHPERIGLIRQRETLEAESAEARKRLEPLLVQFEAARRDHEAVQQNMDRLDRRRSRLVRDRTRWRWR